MTTAKNEISKSVRLIARLHDERRETVSDHTQRVWMQRGNEHTAHNVAICSKHFQTEGHCLRERQRGGLCGKELLTRESGAQENHR